MKKIYLNTLTPEDIIARLKNGEVIKFVEEDESGIIKMIDGVLVKKYTEKIFWIGKEILVDMSDDFYFEEEEKFEITETGLYRTRDGRKAFVSEILTDRERFNVLGLICGCNYIKLWGKDGSGQHILDGCETDLVGKWEE